MNSVLRGDDDAAFQDFGGGQGFGQQPGRGGIVGVGEHGGADGGVEVFALRQLVVAAKEGQRFVVLEPAHQFREWLGGDAQ